MPDFFKRDVFYPKGNQHRSVGVVYQGDTKRLTVEGAFLVTASNTLEGFGHNEFQALHQSARLMLAEFVCEDIDADPDFMSNLVMHDVLKLLIQASAIAQDLKKDQTVLRFVAMMERVRKEIIDQQQATFNAVTGKKDAAPDFYTDVRGTNDGDA